jgi:hypothetical protein
MSATNLNDGQLLARWLSEQAGTLPPGRGFLRIRRAEPRFQTRNFFNRFKVETAKFDGTGQNPTDIHCVVVEVSETDQTAQVATQTACDSVKDA